MKDVHCKRNLIVLALISVLVFGCLGAVQAASTPNYDNIVSDMSSLFVMVEKLDGSDVQNAVDIMGKINDALFEGLDDNSAVLTPAQQKCLWDTYSIDKSSFNMVMSAGFQFFIDNTASNGKTGYDGYIDAVKTGNEQYLSDLMMYVHDAMLEETKNQFEYYGVTFADQMLIFTKLASVKYESGLDFTPEVIQQYDDALQDLVNNNGDAPLTSQMLAECGITTESFQAAFAQLSQGDKQTLEEILDKMGLIVNKPEADYDPADGANGVAINAPVQATFNMNVSEVNLDGVNIVPEGGTDLNWPVTLVDNVLSFGDHPDFSYSTKYTVTIPAGTVKSEENVPNGLLSWQFTTMDPDDDVKPAASFEPADGATGVAINAPVRATFNMNVSEVDLDGVTIVPEGGTDLNWPVTLINNMLSFGDHPDFNYLTSYTVTIPAGAVQSEANVTNDLLTWSFTTAAEGVVSPYIVSVNTNKKGYSLGEDVAVSGLVYENNEAKAPVKNTNVGLILSKDGTPVLVGQVATDDNGAFSWTIAGNNLEPGDYTILATVNAASGEATFKVGSGSDDDTTPPVVLSTDPEADELNVSVSKNITVTFNEEIIAGSNYNEVTLKDSSNDMVEFTPSIDGSVLTIDPNKNLRNKVVYTVDIPANAVMDVAGNELQERYTFSFTTKKKSSGGGGGGGSDNDQDKDDPNDNDNDEGCKFIDLTTAHWAYQVIMDLCERGIINGYPDGSFKMQNSITRAEMTKIFVIAKGLNTIEPLVPSFSDVNQDAWYYEYVETAVQAGLVKGYETGEFRPNAYITREEIAAIVARAMGLEDEAAALATEVTGFVDDQQISDWARGYVVIEKQKGIIDGYPDNSYGPGKNATRAESCAMVSRYLATIDQ